MACHVPFISSEIRGCLLVEWQSLYNCINAFFFLSLSEERKRERKTCCNFEVIFPTHTFRHGHFIFDAIKRYFITAFKGYCTIKVALLSVSSARAVYEFEFSRKKGEKWNCWGDERLDGKKEKKKKMREAHQYYQKKKIARSWEARLGLWLVKVRNIPLHTHTAFFFFSLYNAYVLFPNYFFIFYSFFFPFLRLFFIAIFRGLLFCNDCWLTPEFHCHRKRRRWKSLWFLMVNNSDQWYCII